METTNLIQSTARVVRITNLQKGNLVKYIDTQYSDNKTFYGVVTDILSTGDKAFIEILLYKKSYSDFEVEMKMFSGDKDINIFPATLDDIQEYFKQIESSISKKITDKKDELYRLEKGLETFKDFISGELSKKLSVPDFISISQEEFLENKRLKEEKKRILLEEAESTPF